MDAPGEEEPIGAMGSTDTHHHQSTVYKGKRTKRLRPYSTLPPTSSAEEHQQEYGDDEESPATCLDFQAVTTAATEEEEDVANCLILLAQGQGQGHFSHPPLPPLVDQGYKYSSRRYLEAAATVGAGKVGYYVYQCKTCDRTFPTFQALGGHRASHKKPKSAAGALSHHLALSSEDEHLMIKNNNIPSSLSLQLSNRGLYKANKVHECSICGAEFTSGQALGGHMRRHRGPATTTLSLTPAAALGYCDYRNQEQPNSKRSRNVRSLGLDLNLPAPEDHDQSELMFGSKQHQLQPPPPPLVLSAPALVDCHY